MSEARTAWFHHFWPWFIVGLLAVSVVGSLCTVVIAYRYGDVEVMRTPIAPASPRQSIGAASAIATDREPARPPPLPGPSLTEVR
jgi:hypothetical protein